MKLSFIFLIITICKSEIIILEDDWSIEFKGRDDFYDILDKVILEKKNEHNCYSKISRKTNHFLFMLSTLTAYPFNIIKIPKDFSRN